ncbi:hypothetical protein RSAG8_13501, partial [Rhizoctonia solani AG-8 WAC10335]
MLATSPVSSSLSLLFALPDIHADALAKIKIQGKLNSFNHIIYLGCVPDHHALIPSGALYNHPASTHLACLATPTGPEPVLPANTSDS